MLKRYSLAATTTGGGAAATLLSNLILARLMGPSDYGVVALRKGRVADARVYAAR